MTPRSPSGRRPGRQPAADQDAVRRVVRSARFTQAEAEQLDASGVPLRDLALDGLRARQDEETTEA